MVSEKTHIHSFPCLNFFRTFSHHFYSVGLCRPPQVRHNLRAKFCSVKLRWLPEPKKKTQSAVLAATLQNPVPAVFIPAENHQRLQWSTCPRKSLRPWPLTHLCQGPPDIFSNSRDIFEEKKEKTPQPALIPLLWSLVIIKWTCDLSNAH